VPIYARDIMPDWCYGIITIDQSRQDNKQRVGEGGKKTTLHEDYLPNPKLVQIPKYK